MKIINKLLKKLKQLLKRIFKIMELRKLEKALNLCYLFQSKINL